MFSLNQTRITDFFNKNNNLLNKTLTPKKNNTISSNSTNTVLDFNNIVTNNKSIICFTDGSCIHNGKKYAKGAWGVIFPDYPNYDLGDKLKDGIIPTNNRAEYTALIMALKQADKIDNTNTHTLIVYSDSELLIKSMTKWIKSWKLNKWRKSDGQPVLNKDLLLILDDLFSKRHIVMKHVRSHTNSNTWESKMNDKVDLLAKSKLN